MCEGSRGERAGVGLREVASDLDSVALWLGLPLRRMVNTATNRTVYLNYLPGRNILFPSQPVDMDSGDVVYKMYQPCL